MADPGWDPRALNEPLVVPPAIETVDGTDAAELPLDRDTVIPPEGAVVDRNTVQVAEAPGAIVGGVHDMLESVT